MRLFICMADWSSWQWQLTCPTSFASNILFSWSPSSYLTWQLVAHSSCPRKNVFHCPGMKTSHTAAPVARPTSSWQYFPKVENCAQDQKSVPFYVIKQPINCFSIFFAFLGCLRPPKNIRYFPIFRPYTLPSKPWMKTVKVFFLDINIYFQVLKINVNHM